MAEIISVLSVGSAIRALLRGDYTPTDSTRLAAQNHVMSVTKKIVNRGRRRQSGPSGAVSVQVIDVDRDYHLKGEGTCSRSLVEVSCYSVGSREMDVLQEGVRQLLTSFRDQVTTDDGSLWVAGVHSISESEENPDIPVDGSDDWAFQYNFIFRVFHEAAVPSGLK